MKYLTQTRLHQGMEPHQRGNCWPTALACLLDFDDPEAVPQFQEMDTTEEDNWVDATQRWLNSLGFRWVSFEEKGHVYDGLPYLVSGMSNRGVQHVCIYQDGKLLHDTHPSRAGLLTEEYFERIIPL